MSIITLENCKHVSKNDFTRFSTTPLGIKVNMSIVALKNCKHVSNTIALDTQQHHVRYIKPKKFTSMQAYLWVAAV